MVLRHSNMALRYVCSAALRTGTEFKVYDVRTVSTTATLHRRRPPLGPMPNEDIDVTNLASLEKYRSYSRYFTEAKRAMNKAVWWRTYGGYVEEAHPAAGAKQVDIGLPISRPKSTKEIKERRQVMKDNKRNIELERAFRLRTFKISLDRVQEIWAKTSFPFQVKRLADHYGVFRDLFPNAYFIPRVIVHINYSHDNSLGVHFGNRLTPTEAASKPQISFDAEEGSLWTVLLTCPDEHLLDNKAEYVHWLVGNIPGGAVQAGEELCPYLPPFPPKGTGFHRYIYILFKQDGYINFQEDARPSPCLSLVDRTFKTVDFYRKHEDSLTPAGLAFFQCQWDESVTGTFHNTLNMREPVFEFIRPPVYHPPQVKFPHGKPLRYLDRYRDEKELTYGIY